MFTTVVVMVKVERTDTRQRLIDATLGLVAARGFDGVSVGDIESEAGLAPRSGALYKYFDSKLAVLEAGLDQHLGSVGDAEVDFSGSAAVDPVAETEAVARWLLAELDRERTITHVIEREGDRLPELRDRMREGISDRGYRIAAALIERWRPALPVDDLDSLAVILVGAIINFRRSTWTFGAPPLGLDDERFLETLVPTLVGLLDAGEGGDASRS